MPKGTGRPDTRSEREARDRDRNAARAAATKSKQADAQSFSTSGGVPEASDADLDALGRAINDMASAQDSTFSDFFDLKHTVQKNPATNQYGMHTAKTVSPLGMVGSAAMGLLGGPIGTGIAKVAGIAADELGFEDPLSFDIDLGFGGPKVGNSTGPDDQRDDPGVRATEPRSAKLPDAERAVAAEDDEFTTAFDKLLGDFKFDFYEMPDFELLSNDFSSTPSAEKLAEIFAGLNKQGVV